PALGRLLTPADDSIAGAGGPDGAAAVISYGLWQRRYAGSPSVLGRKIQLERHTVSIVGVTPPHFSGLEVGLAADLTIPIALTTNSLKSRTLWWFSVVGRLKEGAPAEAARAELDALFHTYMAENGQRTNGYFSGIALVPAAKGLSG